MSVSPPQKHCLFQIMEQLTLWHLSFLPACCHSGNWGHQKPCLPEALDGKTGWHAVLGCLNCRSVASELNSVRALSLFFADINIGVVNLLVRQSVSWQQLLLVMMKLNQSTKKCIRKKKQRHCNALICLQLAMHRASSHGTHGVVTHSQKTRFSAHRTSCY